MSGTAVVIGLHMSRVEEIPPNAEAIQVAREILDELRQGGGSDSARRIKKLAETLASLLRDDCAVLTNLGSMMMNLEVSPGEFEVHLREEQTRLLKLENQLNRFREGPDDLMPSSELINALRKFVRSKAFRFRIPSRCLIGDEFEFAEDRLKSLRAESKFVPAEVAMQTGADQEIERKALSHAATVEMIKREWPNSEDLFGVTGKVVREAIEKKLASVPEGAYFQVPEKSAIGNALKEARGYVKSRGAGRSKELRPQNGEKRRNGKRIG